MTHPARRRRGGERDRSGSYRHPVPAAVDLLERLRQRGVPASLDDIADDLGLRTEGHHNALKRRLNELITAGELLQNRRGEYCLLRKLDVVAGTVSSHRDGYGFFVPDDGSADTWLSPVEMRQLMDGDRVAVRITGGEGRGGRRAAVVVEILARGRESVVGRYQREHGIGWVVDAGKSPHRFVVPDRYRQSAQPGELVRVEIMEYPRPDREAQGRITRVIGRPDDPGVLTDAAIELFDLPAAWPAEVEREIEAIGQQVRARDREGREDLRELPLVTIDGEDARDFDDAVYAEPVDGGWRLVVAIADVSAYVIEGSRLDAEARQRGTSVYFVDRVIPMLPEALSNGLCSLNPRVDRLCMVCDMRVDREGRVSASRFYRAVMHSRARLTYTAVDAAVRGTDPAATRAVAPVRAVVDSLYEVYAVLSAARERRGALDLDLPEVKIELDEDGSIRRIHAPMRNDAHRLIEECMIAANVEAGRYLRRHRMPTLYRVHEGPEEGKFEELRLLLQSLGIKVAETARARARELNRVLDQLRDRPDFPMLATAVLRSMSQAVYQPANVGHFGLGLPCYTHFTSPIRRYPDLLVHRGIAHLLEGGKPGAFGYDMPAMEHLGRTTSRLERRADEATRHVEARLKTIYVRDRVGETLDGVVTGVTHFGLFVTLRDLLVDGLVHVTSLGNDYYHLEKGGLRLKGERTGRSFALGDDLRVTVLRVDTDTAKIDLGLEEHGGAGRPSRAGPRRRRR